MRKMRWLLGGLLLFLAGLSGARADELRLRIKGEVGVDPQGQVFDYRIDSIVTPEVKELVHRAVQQWKFEPVIRAGQPAYAKSNMELTLLANRVASGYELRVEQVRFMGTRKAASMIPPRYPREAARAGISGDVLIALRVDVRGKVLDAAPVQFALPYRNVSAKLVQRWGRIFEQASMEAARRWRFELADPAQEESETTLIVPVSFRIGDAALAFDGWRRETAGPQQPIPWLDEREQQFDADGLQQGESLALDGPIKLVSEVAGKLL